MLQGSFDAITKFRLSGTNSDDFWNSKDGLEAYRQAQTRSALIEATVGLNTEDALLPVHLVGQARLAVSNTNETVICLALSAKAKPQQRQEETDDCLILPLSASNQRQLQQLKLVSFAYRPQPLSKSVLLSLNSLLVNRDDCLFDNLPWAAWTVDPQQRNRDAARNVVDSKFHLGKRDAYNVMMGKDWKGRSVSLGNMALRLKHTLQQQDDKETNAVEEVDSSVSLAQRILEIQIRELQMELAGATSELAVARMKSPTEVSELQSEKQDCEEELNEAQEALEELIRTKEAPADDGSYENKLMQLLERVADWTTDGGRNAAPYRGASGYAPLLDSAKDVDTSTRPFTSPYDVLREIIETQLNANVIGAVLENTSLFEGTLALGGAVVLQRRTAKKTVTIQGEELSISDEEEDYGNPGGRGGEIMLVECSSDEAIGMALACEVFLSIETSVWERANLPVQPISDESESDNVMEALPLWEPLNKDISVLVEGQARNASSASQASPLQLPRTTTSLFDSLFQRGGRSSSSSSTLFPTDNPIQSLGDYDALSNEDKARTLLSMSNFEGKLPRARVFRQWDSESDRPNPLDTLLIPLVDESVRRQYLIRDAERRQDTVALEELQATKSPRQVAKEKAEEAREAGSDDVAEWWENEADLYASLRADVTQDEGSYSRFLDKDEWYEREQQALRQRNKKFKFGTLLDGLE